MYFHITFAYENFNNTTVDANKIILNTSKKLIFEIYHHLPLIYTQVNLITKDNKLSGRFMLNILL